MIAVLLVLLLTIKHFLCDIKFQSNGMTVNKRKGGWEGFKGLLKHSSIHALGTFIAVVLALVFFKGLFVAVAMGIFFAWIDLVLHFQIDRFKVIVEKDFNVQYKSKGWWVLMVTDQAAHFGCYLMFVMGFI